MDLNLAGHTAVIAGGARGIGLAIAAAFAKEGANVALLDRDPTVSAAAHDVAERSGAKALPFTVDVTDYSAVQRAAGEIHARLGRTDHIVFAVAIGSGKYGFPFWNLEPGDWGRVLHVNVVGAA